MALLVEFGGRLPEFVLRHLGLLLFAENQEKLEARLDFLFRFPCRRLLRCPCLLSELTIHDESCVQLCHGVGCRGMLHLSAEGLSAVAKMLIILPAVETMIWLWARSFLMDGHRAFSFQACFSEAVLTESNRGGERIRLPLQLLLFLAPLPRESPSRRLDEGAVVRHRAHF